MNYRSTKISFYTLGCRLNQSETASLQGTFKNDDYKIVSFADPADIVVVNTCTVTENGDADTRKLCNKINRLNPKARIALIGCQAQVQKEKLTKLPNVRWVIGNQRKMDLRRLIDELNVKDKPAVITPTISRKSFTIDSPGIDSTHTRANIKIQDGCDFFCSFCEIPYARGRARSRVFADILKEAKKLVSAQHKELIITGINVGTYAYQNYTFMDVINALEQIDGLKRIRISSIEPTTIPEEIFTKMSRQSKLCRHLHIPLQSGSDQVLSAMNRKYTRDEFYQFIKNAYDTVDGICIGTDIIVGFPGETKEQFNQTLDSLENWPIHYAHVFSYSQRHLAQSQRLADPVSRTIIQRRSQALRMMSARKRLEFAQSLEGQTYPVLFEQEKDGYWTGLTDNYVRAAVKSDRNLSNQYLPVELGKPQNEGMLSAKIIA